MEQLARAKNNTKSKKKTARVKTEKVYFSGHPVIRNTNKSKNNGERTKHVMPRVNSGLREL